MERPKDAEKTEGKKRPSEEAESVRPLPGLQPPQSPDARVLPRVEDTPKDQPLKRRAVSIPPDYDVPVAQGVAVDVAAEDRADNEADASSNGTGNHAEELLAGNQIGEMVVGNSREKISSGIKQLLARNLGEERMDVGQMEEMMNESDMEEMRVRFQKYPDNSRNTGPPLRLSDPEEGSRQSGRPVQRTKLSKQEIVDAMRRNAEMLRSDEIPPPKRDILEERVVVLKPVFQRVQFDDTERHFSVVSYNIMAELERDDARPRSEQVGRGKGKAAGKPDPNLVPENHHERIVKELYFLKPDIFCLQSVSDSYWFKLEKFVNNMGYGGARVKRRPDGWSCCEAIFFKKSRFELVRTYSCFLDDLIIQQSMHSDVTYNPDVCKAVESRETLFFLILRCKNTGRKLIAANTRCAPMHKLRPDLQTAQVCAIVQLLKMVSEDPDGKLAVVLCGNLDFEPTPIGPYQVMRDGAISDVTEEVFRKIEFVTDVNGQHSSLSTAAHVAFRHPMQSLKSAYDQVLGVERKNVWKSEDRRFICGSYVWFDEGELDVLGVLDNVPSRAVTGSGIPNEFFPSSHLSLKTFFRFKVPDRDV